ncbi:MAG TPA: hypothetical protein VGG64_23520 [Pirellulales bacterium]|jgi:hypothetical protein
MVTTAMDCEAFQATDGDSSQAAWFLTAAQLFVRELARHDLAPDELESRWRLHLRTGALLVSTLPETAIPDRLAHALPAMERLAERYLWAERALIHEWQEPIRDREFKLAAEPSDHRMMERALNDEMANVSRQLQLPPPYIPNQPRESVAQLLEQGVLEEQIARIWGLSRCDVRRETDEPGSVVTGPDFIAPSCLARIEEQTRNQRKAAESLQTHVIRISSLGNHYGQS